MENKTSDAFTLKLTRLEEIVRALEAPDATLDASVALFSEGKRLADECEGLLVAAEEAIAGVTEDNDEEPEEF